MTTPIPAEDLPKAAMCIVEALATKAHLNQTRRDGSPYITHIKRVVVACSKYGCQETEAVAWFHDAVEDEGCTLAEVASCALRAGFSAEASARIVIAVDLLTHKKEVPYIDYVRALSYDRLAVRVKMCDLCDNITDSPGKKRYTYMEALDFLTQIYPALASLTGK